jgi:hypothetical protein
MLSVFGGGKAAAQNTRRVRRPRNCGRECNAKKIAGVAVGLVGNCGQTLFLFILVERHVIEFTNPARFSS